MRFGSWIASDPSPFRLPQERWFAPGTAFADHVLSFHDAPTNVSAMAADHVGRHHLRATAATATYRVLPIGASWDRPISSPGAPLLFLANDARAPLAICKSVELMRDRQIEGLPCELVAPVRLLLEETRVLHSNPP
jgi:hypothetical protein